jgi:Flp pilus assembly protein TadB
MKGVMMLSNIKKSLEEKVPSAVTKKVQKLLDYAGMEERAESWFIVNFTFSLIFGLAFLTAPSLLFSYFSSYLSTLSFNRFLLLSFILGMTAFALYWIIIYASLFFKIEYRKKRTLEVLPDFLSSVAMNIRAGMEPMSALYVSLRPDFDPITTEMMKIKSLAIGSKSIYEQLSYLKDKIDSEPLRRTISIIDRASRSGGELGRLLLSIADDLRDSIKIQKELETSTKGYVYFITFLTILGIPLLLSVSSVFIQATAKQSQQFTGGFGGLIGGLGTSIPISTTKSLSPDEIMLIFGILLLISSVSASLMLGVLWHGEVKQGLRYTIFFIPLTLIAFFIFRMFMFNILTAFGV